VRPILSIVGKSDSGKTVLLESLIVELKQRGRKVAVIKHDAKHGFELDKEGKDSWRFSQAGSDVVLLGSPSKFAFFKQVEHDLSPQELSRFIGWDYDLILTEGYKRSSTLKIEVHRKEQGKDLLCSPQQLLAVVTDEPLEIDVPQFAGDEVQKIVDLIEDRLLAQGSGEEVDLFVNDAPVPVKEFVNDFIAKTLLGMVSVLKGVKEVKSLHISLRRRF